MNYKKETMPKHIAIIMDGNRRWARSQGKPAGFGHKAGAKTLLDKEPFQMIILFNKQPQLQLI